MASSQKPRLAFYGLGAMGGGMAANLAKAGYSITGFDVYTPLIDKFVAAGGLPSSSPSAAAADAAFIIVMVATMYQTNDLLFSGSDPAIKGFAPNSTLILCSTCPPSYPPQLRELLDKHNRQDVKLLDCPVSGGTIRAAAGTLSIFASGVEADLDAADQVLNSMSANLYRIPGGVSGGQKVKAIHQLMAATNIISAAEAFGLASAAGIDTQAVTDFVKASDGDSFMFSNRAVHMLDADWTPLSALGIIWKDAGIVVDAALAIKFPVPLVSAAEQLYSCGNARGLLRDDDAKLLAMYVPRGGEGKVAELKGNGVSEGKAGVTKETINDLLAGIHFAASVEAMAFCKALEVDRKVMYEIISKAAGWARVFEEHIPAMLEGDDWTLAKSPVAASIQARLEVAVTKCRELGYPAQMGNTALSLFYFAGLGPPVNWKKW